MCRDKFQEYSPILNAKLERQAAKKTSVEKAIANAYQKCVEWTYQLKAATKKYKASDFVLAILATVAVSFAVFLLPAAS